MKPRLPTQKGLDAFVLVGVVVALGLVVIALRAFWVVPGIPTAGQPQALPVGVSPVVEPYPILSTARALLPTTNRLTPTPRPYPIPTTVEPTVQWTPPPIPKPDDPYFLLIAPEPSRPEPKDLAREVTIVVIGTVTKVHDPRWTTKDGSRPENPWFPEYQHTIYRPVEIEVTQLLKGQGLSQTIVIFALGGKVGQDSVVYEPQAMQDYQLGERVVLFLTPNHYSFNNAPLLEVYDRYTISSDDQAINSFQTLPLQKLIEMINSVLNLTPVPTATNN
jgi:hypothetical protein